MNFLLILSKQRLFAIQKKVLFPNLLLTLSLFLGWLSWAEVSFAKELVRQNILTSQEINNFQPSYLEVVSGLPIYLRTGTTARVLFFPEEATSAANNQTIPYLTTVSHQESFQLSPFEVTYKEIYSFAATNQELHKTELLSRGLLLELKHTWQLSNYAYFRGSLFVKGFISYGIELTSENSIKEDFEFLASKFSSQTAVVKLLRSVKAFFYHRPSLLSNQRDASYGGAVSLIWRQPFTNFNLQLTNSFSYQRGFFASKKLLNSILVGYTFSKEELDFNLAAYLNANWLLGANWQDFLRAEETAWFKFSRLELGWQAEADFENCLVKSFISLDCKLRFTNSHSLLKKGDDYYYLLGLFLEAVFLF